MKIKIQIVVLVSIPVIVAFIGAIVSQFIALIYMKQEISNFSENLFKTQIMFSKQFTAMMSNQLNRKIQKFPHYIYIVNSYFTKILNGKVIYNEKHLRSLVNTILLYYDQEDPKLMEDFRKNPLLTSSWYHQNYTRIQEMDPKGKQLILNAYKLAPLIRVIQHENRIIENTNTTYLPLNSVGFGFDYEGYMFMNYLNSSMKLTERDNCPRGKYDYDPRCRYWYLDTIDKLSFYTISPRVTQTNQIANMAQQSCQRYLIYNKDTNQNEIHHVICIEIFISSIRNLFENIVKSTKQWYIIEPRSQAIIYNSKIPYDEQSLKVDNFSEVELVNLQSKEDAQKLNDTINQHYNKWVAETIPYADMNNLLDYNSNQIVFPYNRNGTQHQIILNPIIILDRIPNYTSSLLNISGTQVEIAYLQMNIISDEDLKEQSQKVLQLSNILFISVTIFLAILSFFSICISFYYGLQINNLVEQPILHLTTILKRIKRQGQMNDMYLILQQCEENVKEIFLSKETRLLYESFYQVFQMLLFTSENFFLENESNTLIRLCKKIDFFQQFQNYHAVGITHNNIGSLLLNQQHYFQALEHFSKSIIYAKYSIQQFCLQNPQSQYLTLLKKFCYSDILDKDIHQNNITQSNVIEAKNSHNSNQQNSPQNNQRQTRNLSLNRQSKDIFNNISHSKIKQYSKGRVLSVNYDISEELATERKQNEILDHKNTNQIRIKKETPIQEEQNLSERIEQKVDSIYRFQQQQLHQLTDQQVHSLSDYRRYEDNQTQQSSDSQERQEVKQLLSNLYYRKQNYISTLIAFQEQFDEQNNDKFHKQNCDRNNLDMNDDNQYNLYNRNEINQYKSSLTNNSYNFWNEIKHLLKDLIFFTQNMLISDSLEIVLFSQLSKTYFNLNKCSKSEQTLQHCYRLFKKLVQKDKDLSNKHAFAKQIPIKHFQQPYQKGISQRFNTERGVSFQNNSNIIIENRAKHSKSVSKKKVSIYKTQLFSKKQPVKSLESQLQDKNQIKNFSNSFKGQQNVQQPNTYKSSSYLSPFLLKKHSLDNLETHHIEEKQKVIQNNEQKNQMCQINLNKATNQNQNSINNNNYQQFLINQNYIENLNTNLNGYNSPHPTIINHSQHQINFNSNNNLFINSNNHLYDIQSQNNLIAEYIPNLNSPIQEIFERDKYSVSPKRKIDAKQLLNFNKSNQPSFNTLENANAKQRNTQNSISKMQNKDIQEDKKNDLEDYFKMKRHTVMQKQGFQNQKQYQVTSQESILQLINFTRAEYFLHKQDHKKAAEILTLILEKSNLLMSHYPYRLVSKLKKIFDLYNINSRELNEVNQKFCKDTSMQVALVFSCNGNDKNTIKSLQLTSNLVNEVLDQKNDQLGIILSNYKDGFIYQYMDFLKTRQIKPIISRIISDIHDYLSNRQASDILHIMPHLESDNSQSEFNLKINTYENSQSTQLITNENIDILEYSGLGEDKMSKRYTQINSNFKINQNPNNNYQNRQSLGHFEDIIKHSPSLINIYKHNSKHQINSQAFQNQGDDSFTIYQIDNYNSQQKEELSNPKKEIQNQECLLFQQEHQIRDQLNQNNNQVLKNEDIIQFESSMQSFETNEINFDNFQEQLNLDKQEQDKHIIFQSQYKQKFNLDKNNSKNIIKLQEEPQDKEILSNSALLDNVNDQNIQDGTKNILEQQEQNNDKCCQIQNKQKANIGDSHQSSISELLLDQIDQETDSNEDNINRNQIFHLSIRKAISQLFYKQVPFEQLRFDFFLSNKKMNDESRNYGDYFEYQQKQQEYKGQNIQKYIIYSTDEIDIKNNLLFGQLCMILSALKIKLIILSNKQGDNFLEKENNKTFTYKNNEIIKIFYSINKITKYLSFNRDQFSKYSYSTYIQHF